MGSTNYFITQRCGHCPHHCKPRVPENMVWATVDPYDGSSTGMNVCQVCCKINAAIGRGQPKTKGRAKRYRYVSLAQVATNIAIDHGPGSNCPLLNFFKGE